MQPELAPLSPGTPAALRALSERWAGAAPAERANAQSYVIELCDALGVPRPGPAGSGYEFERPIKLGARDGTETQGYVDCYKPFCFVLEAKHRGDGPAGDLALRRAYGQARTYALNDPSGTPPPYLLVLDVARALLVFHRWGGTYQGYAAGHRIDLRTLGTRPDDVQLLRDVWLDPARRDPRQRAQAVTREIAGKLARLAATLEARGFAQERVARFLMRVVFSCFAEDVGLLPQAAFRQTVQAAGVDGTPAMFAEAVQGLWRAMDAGGVFGWLKLLRFNGLFFKDAEALPLERADIALVLEAARADWRDVEPTIFGTLLTRALDPAERHRLGAEYTPRAFIERLIRPTVEEPVRERWTAVQAEVLQLRATGKARDKKAAERALRDHLAWMRGLRVLDPACGSGNFLYVAMHLLKEVEHEAMQELVDLTGRTELRYEEIGPANFLGIEVKPWAREIAELTLWIGFHQFWRRHHDVQPPEPVLENTGTLECRDAVLAWNAVVRRPERDRPDPMPRIRHPITGELVPDPAARLAYDEYAGARPALWPDADFIVGNPPYLGNKRMRETFGDGYVDALRGAYPSLPEGIDYVMYWWDRAAGAVAAGRTIRAGLITTNSITQLMHQPVVAAAAARGSRVVWAAPDHPWEDATDAAAVRVAMTVLARGEATVAERVEVDAEGAVVRRHRAPALNADLSVGADVATAATIPLVGNRGMSFRGFAPVGAGFVLERVEAERLLAMDTRHADVIRPFRHGKCLAARTKDEFIIDFGTRTEAESSAYPVLFDIVRARVKPERDAKSDPGRKRYWWRFGRSNAELRAGVAGLRRYIATPYVARHRVFSFLDTAIAPDDKVVAIASDDAYVLGVLSSAVHVAWADAAGTRLGVGNDSTYNNPRCFDAFPFPTPSRVLRDRIAALGERLDTHRRGALARDPRATITGIYNVLAKLAAGTPLADKERELFVSGACGVLGELHAELDRLVAEAYEWAWPEPPALVLERLVALHDRRLAEERAGTIRWIRPDYQAGRFGKGRNAVAQKLDLADEAPAGPNALVPWPIDAVGQITVLLTMTAMSPLSVDDAVRRLSGARRDLVARHLETLAILGEVQEVGGGRFGVASRSG